MARNTYPWFKFYSEFLHDPKIRRLAIEERYIWVGLLCLAAESPIRGELWLTKNEPLSFLDIAVSLDVDTKEDLLEKALEKFVRLEMITREGSPLVTKIINWKDRQGSDSPDAIRERVAQHREKKISNDNVTELKRVSNTNVTYRVDKEEDKDRDKEEEKRPPDKPESHVSYLGTFDEEENFHCGIPNEDIKKFAKVYRVSEDQIRTKAEALLTWCQTTRKQKKNYKAFVRKILMGEFGKRTEKDKELDERIRRTKESMEAGPSQFAKGLVAKMTLPKRV